MLETLQGHKTNRPPLWMMRQAGRYLPEYHQVRNQAGGFLQACYTPDVATEITLQPLQRFPLDAAIIFSDILVIPDALGIDVQFKKGYGPRVEHVHDAKRRQKLLQTDPAQVIEQLSAVYQAIGQTRGELNADKTLIGFSGAPWTLAAYLFDEGPSKDTPNLRAFAYQEPQQFEELLTHLAQAIAHHLKAQADAGANVLMLFDSWAGLVPPNLINQALLKPYKLIYQQLSDWGIETGQVLFSRNVRGETYTLLDKELPQNVAFGVGHTTNLVQLRQQLPNRVLQGNLDPAVLMTNVDTALAHVDNLLTHMKNNDGTYSNWVFNLGHGIMPQAKPEVVAAVVDRITL